MFVIFIYIKSRDKVSSAQSKGAQSTFRLSTFDVVVELAPPPLYRLFDLHLTDDKNLYFSKRFP